MNALAPDHFGEFFNAIYGYKPFPWQARLAHRVASAQPGEPCWPEALALPTAGGKTACIDIAIFALACQSEIQTERRTAPRRVFFVVDRRVIVDATFERASDLATKLRDANDGGIVNAVADRLRSLSGEDAPDADPLACFQLRGGMYRDDAWARSPLQATVVVTTVDQFGSRLLFRGYGSSAGMRPIHAGLAANDCLILLDEAHCANPFRQTVSSVRRFRQWTSQSGGAGVSPFQLTLISATPAQDIAQDEIFVADDADRNHPTLGARVKAAKPAKLVVARNARGEHALDRLAERIAGEAEKLVNAEHQAIGVIVNRVATAREVHRLLSERDLDATLLTGRMRPLDRDDVTRDLGSLKTGADREERTRYIVATQTLEVGADLDFDGLVAECASLDALRQRFGRLNRGGRPIQAGATVVVRADQTNPNSRSAADPVYGATLAKTWQWLKERAEKDEIDFGFSAMDSILPSAAGMEPLLQKAPDAPVMLPAHVDAWAQTSPAPAPDPDVAIFLHGPRRGSPEAQVCWRSDLSPSDLEGDGDRAIEAVSLCPPTSAECISVPLHTLRRWLSGESGQNDDSDLEGGPASGDDFQRSQRQWERRVLLWRGPEESRSTSAVSRPRPGDTVVIPAASEGWETFGHIPTDPGGNRVIDLGDRAHLQSRAKVVVRIHPELVRSWPDCSARSRFMAWADWTEDSEEEIDEAELTEALFDLAEELQEVGPPVQWKWLQDAARHLARHPRSRKLSPHPGRGLVLHGTSRVKEYVAASSTLTSEDDSYSATVRVALDDHLCGVERWARRIGQGAGLPAELVNDLALAARLHDVGKADSHFQTMLHGGNEWMAAMSSQLLAKSANYHHLKGGARHELVSVRLIESAGELLDSAHDPDLVLHLVASHHGYCRPFAPARDIADDTPVEFTLESHHMSASPDTKLERLDSGVSERFWQLTRRYGWWGLAWLESLLRLADHRCSEAEQQAREAETIA